MKWFIDSFLFRKQETVIHSLDPRVKGVLLGELFIFLILSRSFFFTLLSLAFVLFFATAGKVLERIGKLVLFLVPLSVTIFTVNFLFGLGTVPSLTISLRFLLIVGLSSLFFLTTTPDDFEALMRWMRVPKDVVLACSLSIRLVPALMVEAVHIREAQLSRGLEMERGDIITRLRKHKPILVPLIVSMILKSQRMAEALEVRGYGAGESPAYFFRLEMDKGDRLVLLFTLVLGVFLAALLLLEAGFPI